MNLHTILRQVGRARGQEGVLTLEVLGRQNDGPEMVVLNQGADLGRDLGAIPAHDKHLANGPGRSERACQRANRNRVKVAGF